MSQDVTAVPTPVDPAQSPQSAPPPESIASATAAAEGSVQSAPIDPASANSPPSASAAPSSASTSGTEENASRPRIKIGSQRDSGPTKIPPRVTTEFKTLPPPKQVFLRMDSQGNFAPLNAPAPAPGTPPQGQRPAQVQRPPQKERPAQPPRSGQGQRPHHGQQRPPQGQQGLSPTESSSPTQRPVELSNNPSPPTTNPVEVAEVINVSTTPPALRGTPDHAEPAPAATPGDAPQYRPKPAPLGASPKNPAFIVEKSGPRIEKPSIRAPLSEDLEAELAAALGEDSLNELIDQSSKPSIGASLPQDTKQPARVLRVTREFVFVELPGMNQGSLQTIEFGEKPPEPGTVLEVMVTRFQPEEGLYEVNLTTSAINVSDWNEVSEGMVVDARISGHNKGGLECEVNRLRGFIPAGQVSLYRVEDLSQFVGQRLTCVITEANRERRNLVLSHKAILEREQAEAREKLKAELEVGQEREAVIRSIRDFGAFADLGGMDGLIHISQLSWERVKHPSEVLTEGQRVKVKIQKIDPDTGKISLSLRDLFQNPWETANLKYPVSSIVSGTVSRIMEFGAFVKLEAGVEGLVHISEISHKRIFRVADVLTEGQPVDAKVLSLDIDNQKIGLSIKALTIKPELAKKAAEDAAAAAEEAAAEAAAEEAAKSRPVRERKVPLKGGVGRGSGGEQFGLKW
ncbi:MAG: S1 RNA-binding domain-containing protein [Pirellulales bacterium]|nr:S1 RNA-binding domain-containing protein [Pirellulales bacterium]